MTSGLSNLKLRPLTSRAPSPDVIQCCEERGYFMNQYRGTSIPVYWWWWHIVTTLSRYWRHQPSQPRCNNQLNIYDAALSLILHVIDINILNIEIKTEHISNVYISYKDWDQKARLNNINFYNKPHSLFYFTNSLKNNVGEVSYIYGVVESSWTLI